jgi:hypothetical protein
VNTDNSLQLFPNPANENVTVSIQKGMITAINILDVTGRSVKYEKENAKTVSFDVSELSKGIYFLKVTDENSGVHVIRFVRN